MKDSIFYSLLAVMALAILALAMKATKEEAEESIDCLDMRLVVASYQVCSANLSCKMEREGILEGMRLQVEWEATCQEEKKDERQEGKEPKKGTRDLQASN